MFNLPMRRSFLLDKQFLELLQYTLLAGGVKIDRCLGAAAYGHLEGLFDSFVEIRGQGR